MNFTRYDKLYKPNTDFATISFHDFIDELTRPNDQIDRIRKEVVKERKDFLKKELPGYCFAGTFTSRSEQGFETPSGLAILDYDKIPTEAEYTEAFLDITKLPFVLAAWRSPSGNGFKVLIKIPQSDAKTYELRLRTFAEYYGNKFLDLDADVCRFCFLSHDPTPYVNEAADEFTAMFAREYFEQPNNYNNDIINAIDDEDKAVQILARFRRSTSFTEGQRNRHTFNIASQFCEYGVSQEKCIEFLHTIWSADFEREGRKAVASAYKTRRFNSKQLEDRSVKLTELKFPFEIFPIKIRDSIFDVSRERSLDPVFLATCGLWTISSLAGTAYRSEIGGARNIIYAMMVAPVSVGKTPAHDAMRKEPLQQIERLTSERHKQAVKQWEEERRIVLNEKKSFTKEKPRRFTPFSEEATTESLVCISQIQPCGQGVYYDEAEAILGAGAFKQNNDSISFFTKIFGGGQFVQLRVKDERVVDDININVLMSTQTTRLHKIFTEDRLQSGFASRFLMVESDYKQLNIDADPFSKARGMCPEWTNLLSVLYDASEYMSNGSQGVIDIVVTDDAKTQYKAYYRRELQKANERIENKFEGFIIATEAKMSTYFSRLTQIIAILQNPLHPKIDKDVVNMAYKTYRFYADSTINILAKLHVEIETGLPTELDNLYNALPGEFTMKDAEDICAKINLSKRKFRSSLRNKEFKVLFDKIDHGKYIKK